ncbi:hypothetical protein [Nonomuraea jiangxiensis]|uniref:Uncharacterized protein n=1 Tax=Nonomuraea jiangxiensis TaxID=633440 RepID=A0A1G9S5X2_9ACTN|nr:hypothetical protein [Nonomuraea jiangxiensis]SDM30727.1 hypothetical protein SAMN05421869_14057 [Nonomuraea jiangxiensis]
MNRDQPGRQEPDPNQTIRVRYPHPTPPPSEEPPSTQRLPYTPDMLPDVSHYEAKPRKSAWWWMILVGGLLLLIAALAVAAILWARSTADNEPAAGTRAAITLDHEQGQEEQGR